MPVNQYDQHVIDFFKNNFYLIDKDQYYDVFTEAYNIFGEDDYSNFLRIIELIKEACAHNLTLITKDLLQVWEEVFMDRVEVEKNNHYNTDPSNGWSRLDWMFEAIGTFNLDKDLLVNHLLENQGRLGLNMKPLKAEYGYFGSKTWDLGWFDKQYYTPLD